MHIGVLFYNIGGYHAARLRAAQFACDQRAWDLTAIQVTDQTGEHPWGNVQSWLTFPTKTLLPYADVPDETMRQFESPAAAERLNDVLKSMHLDALAIPGWGFPVSRAALEWCRQQGIPAILMSESKWDDAPRAWWKEWWKSWRYVSRFDAALVGGETHRDYLMRLGMATERIFLGYDAVDNAYFAEQVAIARRQPDIARQRQPAIPHKPYFLAVTRLIPRKNVAALIRAYGTYYQLHGPESMDLVICGSGAEEPALRNLIRQEGLENCVHLPGFLSYDALPDWYALAAALIHPALQEQWGLVVNEACAAGLPILCSRTVGACPELVHPHQNGLVFPPEDESAIAQCLSQFHKLDPETRMQWGQQSQQIVARFSPVVFAEGLMQALDCARVGKA
ncbi:glycosyltransferase family 4 protein [Leptolyngbya sp. FACHB-16]|uniref:glycosyltransferase family 4 protein n=1 Tax=unclassified Leptolyngbya TaxID=2650499 RepID=UPI001686C10A|nr:glycosyltransferase family 4 protein [Leptolyngbya sp. FACHB-16]MBD2157415.1 glycosyltransferase family 4 protein [Leptolyngbya sp. FACHB-16]